LGALASDWKSARDCGDLDNFLVEFGYNESSENIKRGKRIFEQIRNNNARLVALGFSLPDLEQFIQD
jgi:UDP-N-acetyl-D-mannosaminuronic acid transferase (WecB/TagA/CpsF family)